MSKSCVLCGNQNNVINHHIYDTEFTVPLCRKCHAHEHPKRKHKSNLLTRNPAKINRYGQIHIPAELRNAIDFDCSKGYVEYILNSYTMLVISPNTSIEEIIPSLRQIELGLEQEIKKEID
jgi:ribosomal protein L28